MKSLLKLVPGIIFCFAIASIAWTLGELAPLVGGPIFAILAGMALSLVGHPDYLDQGIAFTGKKGLQYSIVFLGFGLDFGALVKVGADSLAVMGFTLAAAFITAWLVGKALKVDSKVKILVGVGTAICGGSAIAATAPVIDASDEEVARSISTIFLFNIVAAFLFPVLGHLMGMTQTEFGLWAGTAINDTSSVVAAAFAYGDEAGRYATVVKLTRTLMIIPVTLVLAFVRMKRNSGGKGRVEIAKIVPWFVLGFLAASLARTFIALPGGLDASLPRIGKFGICMAMAAIGLRSDPRTLVRKGAKPILLGLACWIAVAAVSLIVQRA